MNIYSNYEWAYGRTGAVATPIGTGHGMIGASAGPIVNIPLPNTQVPHVAAQIDCLLHAISRTEELLASPESRLAPVIAPVPKADCCGNEACLASCLAPLAETIRTLADRLASVNGRLDYLLGGIEI